MSIYDQLARQVEALRKENTHLRRELEDNTNQLSKLEDETSNMKEVMKQLQRKLKKEAHTLTPTGRSDKLTQHKGSHMDSADCSELECLADVLRLPSDCLAAEVSEGEDSACRRRDVSPLHAATHLGWSVCGESMATHLLEGIIPRAGANGGSPVTSSQDWEDICKGRSSLLGEPEEEEEARYWCYSQLRGLSRQLMDFPGVDTTSSFERPEPEITLHSSIPGTGEAAYKVEALFWLLSLLAMRDREEVSCTLLALSSCRDICMAMRRSGCVPLLVQILHVEAAPGEEVPKVWGRCSRQARSRISAALHNIVYAQPDEGQARREKRVLRALEQIRAHCDSGWDWIETSLGVPTPGAPPDPLESQICQATCVVVKLSFVEEYRQAMNELGALHAIAELMQLDCEMYGTPTPSPNMLLRRYAGMALTNLTFRDVVNKATLCSKKDCLRVMVAQLSGHCEDLHQVVSSILRNLSWRADINSKEILKDVGSVSALMTCAMQATKESTLKSLLSALWNLSAHSTENKLTICSAHGALGFLVSTLTYKCQNNSLVIIESGGGILRNVSSLIATREDYRQVLRDHNCLQTLLQHLRSHSLTIVSNACGTLWNLSTRSSKDQELLWDLGAVGMLRNLVHSKHKMIAMGSAAALRNLITNRPHKYKEAAVISPGFCTPSLFMRKQKALEAELHANHLAEISDSTDNESPKHTSIKRPLRHSENPAKDYASDSGCFDDDETTNFSSSLDTGSFSMLSIFLNNSNILHNQPCKTEIEPEQDMDPQKDNDKKSSASIGPVPNVAEKHNKMITCSLVKINKLVDDVSMHISSEDSFSLSSEDNFVEWQCRPDVLHEARAKSCSPCRQSDTGSFKSRENLSKAHAHLYVKTAYKGLSTEGVNCSSAIDDFCSNKDQIRASVRSATVQKRPYNLDLKVDYYRDLEQGARQAHNQGGRKQMQKPPQRTPMTVAPTVSSEATVITAKSPPSYEKIPLIQHFSKFGVGMTPIGVQPAQAITQQTWMPTVPTSGFLSEFSTINCSLSPTEGQVETLQKYSVENTPICFSRCSSLSSLSSGEGALEKQSPDENELESDSSLESIEVEECDRIPRKKEGETSEDPRKKARPDQKTSVNRNGPLIQPIQVPCAIKREKALFGKVSPERPVDTAPSSSSENYFLETPLVMSRCSSVSSLGSFESPTIASSGQSDSFSEIISGTISPSDLPDSPGQTMPPSRSKTPCSVDPGIQVTPIGGCGGQEECRKQKSVEISDFGEKFSLPEDFDPMIPYFTVEKPIENFSCASSLSALPLHDHYIQKDVELKLMPLHHHWDTTVSNADHVGRDEAECEQPSGIHVDSPAERSSDCNSDDDIEILKECINSAMPSRLKNATHFHKSHLHQPVYEVPSHNSEMLSAERAGMSEKYFYLDNTYFNDSWKLEDWELKEPKQMKRVIKKVMETQAAISQIRRQNQSPNSISQNHEQVHLQNLRQLDQCITKQSTENQNALCIEMSQSNLVSQSVRHPAPTEEDIDCLHDDCTNMKVEGKILSLGKKGDRNVLNNSAANVDQGASTQSKHTSVVSQIKPGYLIMDETPPFYSLSSSVSSLSDAAFQDHSDKTQQTWNKNRHHIMADSICDGAKLLNHHGITSATPKKRWQRTPKKERKRKPKSHALKSLEVESEEKATNGDSDLDSVEWKAIQEGAGIVVARLQAASEAREPPSESESMLSITSSVSAGSSLHPKPRRVIRKNNVKDHSNKVNKMSEDRNLRTQTDFSQHKPVSNLPMDFRGRAVTHMSKKEGITLQKQTTKMISPKVETSIKNLNIDLTQQRSSSVNRLGHLNDASQMSVSERSATPPARIPKSSSQSSTALKQSQKKQTTSQIRKPIQKKGTKTANCQADQRGNVSASPDEKPGHNNYPAEIKTHKSPVRIPFMQKPCRLPSTTNSRPPLVTNKPSCVSIKNKDLSGSQTRHANHLKKVHMTTGYSNSNNIDQNSLVRQLTFIKESASDLRHGVPCSQPMPTSQIASHQEEVQERRQGQLKSQRREQRPLGKSATLFRASSNDRNLTTKHPARRTSSVSPCRQSNLLGNQQRKSELFNQPSSFPSLTSLNSSTNSSGAEKNQKGPKERQQQRPGSQISGKMTWRRIKDDNVPQMPSVWSNAGQKQVLPQVPGKLPAIPMPSRKASDAIVQTDDFTANDANSSASPTNEKAPVKEEVAKISTDPASNIDMQDARGFDNSFKSHNSASSSQSVEGHDLSAEDISQGLPRKAVRVIPYSYTPSSLACGLQNTQMQATKPSGTSGEPLEA